MEGRKNGIMEENESWDREKVTVTSRVTTSRTRDLGRIERIDLINSFMPLIDQYSNLYTIQSLASTHCPS